MAVKRAGLERLEAENAATPAQVATEHATDNANSSS